MSVRTTWPTAFWGRFAFACAFLLPLCLVGFVTAGLIMRMGISEIMVFFAVFGIVTIAAAGLVAAALNAPGSDTPLASLRRRRHT